MKRQLYILGTLVAIVSPGFGQVTGLVSIPVADSIGYREIELGYSIAGLDHSISKQYSHGSYVLLGLDDRVEVAAASELLGQTVWGLKYVVHRSTDDRIAVSMGVQNVYRTTCDYFAVARFNYGPSNIHLGWVKDTNHRGVLGVDYSVNRWTFGADFSSNADGSTWVGAWYEVGQGFTLNFSYGRPNTKGVGDQHSAALTYATRF